MMRAGTLFSGIGAPECAAPKPAADGPRYRAVGNSMAVPVIGWVLQRVQQIAAASLEEAA
jgi:site-specific DNA-cytosine methylase